MYDEFADFKAIAVLGITGGGKSTFIRYATGGSDEIMIGGRLES
jgi:ABC-type phosphate/phosphonate transport system ATPase subunit